MRPQHITAENSPAAPDVGPAEVNRFNEAAAYHCGKRRMRAAFDAHVRSGFNEAAAYHCGKLDQAVRPDAGPPKLQ